MTLFTCYESGEGLLACWPAYTERTVVGNHRGQDFPTAAQRLWNTLPKLRFVCHCCSKLSGMQGSLVFWVEIIILPCIYTVPSVFKAYRIYYLVVIRTTTL